MPSEPAIGTALAAKFVVTKVLIAPVIVACLAFNHVFTSVFVYGALEPLIAALNTTGVLNVAFELLNDTRFNVLAEFLTLTA